MEIFQQLPSILPEIILTVGILFILIIDLIIKDKRPYTISVFAFLFYFLSFAVLMFGENLSPGYIFQDQIHADSIAFFVRVLLLLIGMIAVMISYNNPEIKDFLPAELQVLLMGSVLGGMFMAMASNMVMVYLAIEFVSLLSYLLTAVKIRNSKAYEGAIKYVLFGGVASGILLFGLSYLYGISGSLNIALLGKTIKTLAGTEKFLVWTGFAFVMGGLFYKIAVVPFHAWCPDVYEGAATPITAFFSVGPKIAGFALLIRFFSEIFSIDSFASHEKLFMVLGIVSAFTMTLGNFAALRQKNIKRLLAYSSIAHAGYLLAGFSAYSVLGNQAVLFYLLAYLIMNTGAFLVAMAVGTMDEIKGEMTLESFDGLAYRGPKGAFWASIMTVFLVSLTGIPPFVGFIGKYYIFSALLKKEIYWLAIVGALNTVVSLYYYALILKSMFFNKMDVEFIPGQTKDNLFSTPLYSILGVVLVILTFVFGIFPSLISLPK